MNKAPSVSEGVEFFEQFRATAQEFAAREAELNRDFRLRLDAAEKRRQKQIESVSEEKARAAASEQSRFTAAKQRLEQQLEARNNRIARAHASAKSKEYERIEAEEGRRKYAVQKATLERERTHEEEVRSANTRLAEFEVGLAQERQNLERLEHDTWQAFRSFGGFRKRLAIESTEPETASNEYQLLEKLQKIIADAEAELSRFRHLWLVRFFTFFPLWAGLALIIIAALGLGAALEYWGGARLRITHQQAWIGGGMTVALLLVLYFAGRARGAPLASRIAELLAHARSVHTVAGDAARAHRQREIQGIESETRARNNWVQQEWTATVQEAAEARELAPKLLESKRRRAVETNARQHAARIAVLERAHAEGLAVFETDEKAPEDARGRGEGEIEKLKGEQREAMEKLHADWKATLGKFLEEIREAQEQAGRDFPKWSPENFEGWTPPSLALGYARFGELGVEVNKFCEAAPQGSELCAQLPASVALPLLLKFPREGSLLFETSQAAEAHVAPGLNNIILRLLTTFPAGKLNFTLIDPVKLGENFAAVLHLGDYEQDLINGRIWTQPTQVEEQLAELNEHIEKVIQMYLRNEYETIAEYNAQAGNIAEKYRFLVIADFPHNFTDTAARRLLRIISSGPRCGVFTLMHWDQRHPAPQSFVAEEFRKHSICLHWAGNHFALAQPALERAVVRLDLPPAPEFTTDFLHRVGQASVGASRVTVPFAQVAPSSEQVWSLETGEEIRVPIGRSGATKLQHLALGKGTRQHTLIAGKTGSGKSTLLHVMITNLALWCSPEEVEFYLVDFKRGVEFKDYATHRLPHARVVAIESDREFGLSVLQRVDEELKRRGELFREAGVQDISGYRKTAGAKPMPRSLLIIDEFQEFFVEDDRISQSAAVLLDRIVRQGRAFGLHVVLGSQTLGGAYTLARSTMGQMVVRIALQCNEADSYLIMDESNPAPRLLSRPGEGIYNDMAGNIEGNSPFQTVWLSPEERQEALEQVRHRAEADPRRFPAPVVFEGNAPADVRENSLLQQLLAAKSPPPGVPRIWLGAPNSIKGPTEAVFQNRSGSNLLIVGQREESVLAIITISLLTLSAEFEPGGARFVLFTTATPERTGHDLLHKVTGRLAQGCQIANPGNFEPVLTELSDELQRRANGDEAGGGPIFLFVHELQHFRKLKPEDEFSISLDDSAGPANPPQQLNKFLTEGPPHGMHLIATIDTANNVNRLLGRKGLSEFEMRVLFQMSAQDSATLCDEPKASALGLHRALLYNEQQGSLETFRPYALPPAEWWTAALERKGA